jgi:hypothetical protein
MHIASPDGGESSPSSYQQLRGLCRQSWAWEYLRRNPTFRARLAATLSVCEQILEQDCLRVFRVYDGNDKALTADCIFASSADHDAQAATIVWNPASNPSVFRAIAAPVEACTGAKAFELKETTLPATLLVTADGHQHLVVQDGDRRVQLSVNGVSLLDPVALVVDTAVASGLGEAQSRAFRCFGDFRATGQLLDKHFAPARQAERLCFVLQALDGWLAGASHRDIAVALYGEERVKRDWNDAGENMRDRIRHAIVRGRTLMERGYRAFLR